MARQNFVFYEKTNPFPGWIRFYGKVDPNELPDGSTLKERLDELLIEYPDAGFKLFPFGDEPDPEQVKFDQTTETLVPLDPGDVTPAMQKELNRQQRAQDIVDNLPSWSVVKNAINTAFPDPKQNKIITGIARIVYWLAKNRPD